MTSVASYAVLNAVASDKLGHVLARVLEKMAANERQVFTASEKDQLQSMLGLSGEQIDAVVDVTREIFQDAATFGHIDRNLLTARGVDDAVLHTVDKMWRKKGRQVAASHAVETPSLALQKTNWRLHLEMGDSKRSGQSQPTAIFQLDVADQSSSKNEMERLDVEFSHAELRSLFLQLNAIQAELDAPSTPSAAQENAPMPAKVADEFPLLTAVQVVYRECFRADQGDFPHVARRIDAFLGDFASSWTLASAYECTGSLRFLKLLAVRKPTDREPDPLYQLWQFDKVATLMAARGDLESMEWLAEIYLPGASLSAGATTAAGSGDLQILRWMFQEYNDRVHWGGLEWCEALRGDHKGVVDWLRENVALHSDAAPRVMFEAARAGNLGVVQWLLDEHELPVSRALKAAQEGHQWRLVQWILVNYDVADRAVDADAAAKDGELEFLQWAYEHALVELGGCSLLNAVAFNGHLDVLKWLHDGPAKIEIGASVFAQAARGGHLEMVKWLHSHQCPATAAAMDHAAEGGFLELVEWLNTNRDEGCTSRAMDGAARNGHLEVVEWLHDTGKKFYCPFVMDSAAANGHLEVVKWLHEHRSEGCTEDAMNYAARLGHLNVVKWLHKHRSEGCSAFAMDWAAGYGHLAVVKWLHAHRSEGCTTWAMDSAAREGHLDVVKWLHRHRPEGCTTAAMSSAAASGHLAIVRWFQENRSEGCTSTAMARALAAGHFDVVLFLRQERSLKVNYAAGNVIASPCLEMVQWLLANTPAELEGVWFRVSRGDWRMNEWAQRHRLRQTYQDDRYSDWVWEG